MIEEGTVVDVNGGKLIVSIRRNPACGSCKACSTGEDRRMMIELENTIGACKNDKVDVELDDFTVLKGAFLLYGLPLLGLLIGIFAGKEIARVVHLHIPYEVMSTIAGIVTMAIAAAGARRYIAASAHKERHKPKALRIRDR